MGNQIEIYAGKMKANDGSQLFPEKKKKKVEECAVGFCLVLHSRWIAKMKKAKGSVCWDRNRTRVLLLLLAAFFLIFSTFYLVA